MPGLLRGIARTAVIAGTATSVSNRVSRRQGQRWAAQQAPQPAAPVPPPPPASPPTAGVDRLTALKQLGELRDQGVLTDDEFNAEKTKILGS
ncbi:MAG: SHOCT domain-containing protein [Rhodococcus sp. (in: high G+C Gram-positive bacteria)]